MGVRPEILAAISGGGLSAGDYAGMTPEQIAMVAGQGQKDRNMQIGLVENMRQSELAEQKQTQEEMHQDRMFKLMQQQEARQEFQAIHGAMFDHMSYGLQQQKLALEKMQTSAALANSSMERKKLDMQLKELNEQKLTLDKMRDHYLEIPGYTNQDGTPLKMSIGELYATGTLDKAIDAGLRRVASQGGSKVVELRNYMADVAADMGASEIAVQRIKLMGPEAVKGMNKSTVLALHMKNNSLFSTLGEDEKQRIVNKDLALIDMLKVDLASQISSDGDFGADTPGGKPPAVRSLEDIMMEEGY